MTKDKVCMTRRMAQHDKRQGQHDKEDGSA